jgi:hypothetical protein
MLCGIQAGSTLLPANLKLQDSVFPPSCASVSGYMQWPFVDLRMLLQEATAKFQALQRIYEVLSDPVK